MSNTQIELVGAWLRATLGEPLKQFPDDPGPLNRGVSTVQIDLSLEDCMKSVIALCDVMVEGGLEKYPQDHQLTKLNRALRDAVRQEMRLQHPIPEEDKEKWARMEADTADEAIHSDPKEQLKIDISNLKKYGIIKEKEAHHG